MAGLAWLHKSEENPKKKRPKDLWLDFEAQLAAAFDEVCCYTAMYAPGGEADHFIPWSRVRGTHLACLAYIWSNFRYSHNKLNKSKSARAFPDPFIVQDDWFELQLPSLELACTKKVPKEHQAAVDALLEKTRDAPWLMRARRRYFREYRQGACSLGHLDRHAPLLARALRANPVYLHPADRP